MAMTFSKRMPWWAWVWPLAAGSTLAASNGLDAHVALTAVEAVVLIATVFAAVYHAEVVAHKVGEPFGTLVLALAVTIIEVALIASVMLGAGAQSASLARDTVFAAVMLICNGIVGICLLVGGLKHHEQEFQSRGASAALAVLAALMTLSLVLPNYTTSANGPVFSFSQLVFAGSVSLVLYCAFIFIQTIRHREYFLPSASGSVGHAYAAPPSVWITLISFLLLLVCLGGVVGLAKTLTPVLDAGVAAWGMPRSVVGIAIAGIVLLPEGLAAVRAARLNRLQTSMNLAFGSALATIGLTIPAVAGVSVYLDVPLALGLRPTSVVLLALTLLVSFITLGSGRTTVLQGVVHLVIVAAFLFLAVVP